jgi:CheY-like chemotaxis protein
MPSDRPAVLVVDDEPAVRDTAVEAFKLLGVEAFDADGGESALRVLSGHPEIVLLFADVRMPGMDGRELAVEAKRMRPKLRIVLTSGYAGEPATPRFRFLCKPWRLADLKAVLGSTGEAEAPA